VTVGSFDSRRYISVGSSSARDLTVAQHTYLNDLVR
jgi:hypothetical protein